MNILNLLKKKDLMRDVFLQLGYTAEDLAKDGYQAKTLKENAYFNKAVAEYQLDLMMKEDEITSNPTIDPKQAEHYRKYYSEMRCLLDGLIDTLDTKIFEMENPESKDDKEK